MVRTAATATLITVDQTVRSSMDIGGPGGPGAAVPIHVKDPRKNTESDRATIQLLRMVGICALVHQENLHPVVVTTAHITIQVLDVGENNIHGKANVSFHNWMVKIQEYPTTTSNERMRLINATKLQLKKE